MKFKEFIKNDFRVLKVGLVREKSNYDELVREIDDDLLELRKLLNTELGRSRFKFDFCLKEDININDLRIKPDKKKRIKQKWYQMLDELAKTQTEAERKLSSNADDGTSPNR
ncbi:MAG: hypothetical protein ACW99Q_15010 [Candidatus Kariarchaeaceae archaeon]|jgi:hypothetical protein